MDDSEGGAAGYYARSTDSGLTFSEPVKLSSFANGNVHKPTVAAFQDTVYVAFQNGDLFGEESIKNRQVFVVKSVDAGANFGGAEQVSDAVPSRGRAHSPAIVIDSRGTLHMVWIDASIVGNDEGLLFYANSSDGRRFSPQRMILAVI